ncbi:hypothetical protein OCGS_1009 [Oceaniovalibus guishaninsula JLT2003]|uniref:DUF2948 family protein n=1 Tax=Oceaniovalibus guishaninsula JLT2003 TaxID=1231392 RepID=K2HQ63_9RHOB|nr:DUF2948 family protein [Oceaniovalibus guishaninsula]EKE44974.1 hypothetical protein OCGS_1009 [Oceaniovalibus guishaninsula JLT2003]
MSAPQEDARFRDARSGPLRLRAMDADDLRILSALAQDAVFPVSEMSWLRGQRRFGLLLNRVRWEDRAALGEVERVQSVLAFEDVGAVRSQGIDRADPNAVLSLLSVTMDEGEDGAGRILLTLAGGGAIALEVEALEATLRDVTRPYRAPSGKLPQHRD